MDQEPTDVNALCNRIETLQNELNVANRRLMQTKGLALTKDDKSTAVVIPSRLMAIIAQRDRYAHALRRLMCETDLNDQQQEIIKTSFRCPAIPDQHDRPEGSPI